MQASDVIPVVWFAVAVTAAARARRVRSYWPAGALAVLLASLHHWGWNKPIYAAGRELLMHWGVYDDRLVFKVMIGLVFFPLVAWAAWRAWRWSARLAPLHRVACAAMAVDALYVAVRTLSIDGWMPIAIGVEPGKSLLGLSLAVAALVALALAGAPPEGDAGAR